MAVYEATIESPMSQTEAFDYMADFSNAREWDPSVSSAELLEESVRQGSHFRLKVNFAGREIELDYEMTEFDPHNKAVLRAENSTTVSLDTITVEPRGTGSLVTYHADLSLKGPLRLFDLGLGLLFNRLGDNAKEGLQEALGAAGASN